MTCDLILAILVGLAIHYKYKTQPLVTVLFMIVTYAILSLILNKNIAENFTSSSDDERVVRYGDTVTIWTWRNTYIRNNNGGNTIDTNNSRLREPEELPRGWAWERFVIEDGNGPDGPGNRGAVKFGDNIYLRTYNNRWLSSRNDNSVRPMSDRLDWERHILESPDVDGKNGQMMQYGDMFYLRNWRKQYLSMPERSNNVVQLAAKNNTCSFRMYDEYGQGQSIDWARRGQATQSSNYANYPPYNAIDGNFMTFNHTQADQNSWWQVRLPKNVFIEKIVIENRRDESPQRLRNFDVILMDAEGHRVTSRYIPHSQKTHTITGLNQLARIVRVQLRYKNFLHMGQVRVYGKGIDYSVLLENPNVADVLNKEVQLSDSKNYQIYNDDVPYVGRSYSSSYSFFVKLNGTNTGSRSIMSKGSSKITPHVFLNNGMLSASVSTEKQGAETVNTTFRMPANKWTHIALVVDGGVSPGTGWEFGSFNKKPANGPDTKYYVVNPVLRKYYFLRSASGEFAKAVKNNWDTSLVSSMQYMGELSTAKLTPHLQLYVNGRLLKTGNLSGNPLHNNSALYFGKPQDSKLAGTNISINRVKVYNYAVTNKQVRKESMYGNSRNTVEIVSGALDANKLTNVEPNMLPEVNDQFTVSFWLFCQRPSSGTKRADSILVKGNGGNDRCPGLWFAPNSNQLTTLVNNKGGAYWGDGIKQSKYSLKNNAWNHIALSLNKQQYALFINGKMDSQVSLPGEVVYSISPVALGGFKGKLFNVRFSNFAMNTAGVANVMGRYPDYTTQEKITKLWRQQGCTSNLFADPTNHADWVDMVKSGNTSKVEDQINDLKARVKKGDNNAIQMCYGDSAGLYSQMSKHYALLKHTDGKQGKKCLPSAPFECKNRDINDFDIRTHKDFYKYTLTDHVIPPATSAGDFSVDSHPDYTNLQTELTNTKNSLTQMTQLRDELAKQLNSGSKGADYDHLQSKYKMAQQQLTAVNAQLKTTQQKMQSPQNVDNKQLTQQLKQAREIATANIAKSLDLNKLRNNPLFKDILKQLMSKSGTNISNLESQLKAQKTKLNTSHTQTLQQLAKTQQTATEIYQGLSGITGDQMQAIAQDKKGVSDNKDYRKVVKQVQKLGKDPATAAHPESQKLAKQLNEINKSDVDANAASGNKRALGGLFGSSGPYSQGTNFVSNKFNDLKVQSGRCRNLIQRARKQGLIEGFDSKPKKSKKDKNKKVKNAMKIINRFYNQSPEIQALVRNIINTRAEHDPELIYIVKQSNTGGYQADPNFQSLIQSVVRQEMERNQGYCKVLVDLLANNPKLIRMATTQSNYPAAAQFRLN